MRFEIFAVIFMPIIIAIVVFLIANYLSGYRHLIRLRFKRPLYVGLAYIKNGEKLLLIRKEHEPYIGSWVLPGGMEDRVRGQVDEIMRKIAEERAENFLNVKLTTRRILHNGTKFSMEASLGFRPAYIYLYETIVREGTIKESQRIKYWNIDEAIKHNEVAPIVKELIKRNSER